MFSWITPRRRDHKAQESRRAFRPEGDRLESREVLTSLGLGAGTTAVAVPKLTTPGSSTAGFSLGRVNFSNFGTLQNGLGSLVGNFGNFVNPGNFSSINTVQFGRGPGNIPTQFFSAPSSGSSNTTTSTTASTPATTANLTHTPTTTTQKPVRTVPRAPGSASNVNPNLFQVGSNPGSLVSSIPGFVNTGLSNASAVTNGLAFTFGQGFSNLNNQFNTGNAAQTGLAFLNQSGFGNPSGTFFNNSLNNGAQTGLAFTNGTGGTLPASTNPTFNSATTGLTFGSGAGFTNQSTNPFAVFGANSNPLTLNSLTTIGSGSSQTSQGLGNGFITIGNPNAAGNSMSFL